jgi:hypothetical protein
VIIFHPRRFLTTYAVADDKTAQSNISLYSLNFLFIDAGVSEKYMSEQKEILEKENFRK